MDSAFKAMLAGIVESAPERTAMGYASLQTGGADNCGMLMVAPHSPHVSDLAREQAVLGVERLVLQWLEVNHPTCTCRAGLFTAESNEETGLIPTPIKGQRRANRFGRPTWTKDLAPPVMAAFAAMSIGSAEALLKPAVFMAASLFRIASFDALVREDGVLDEALCDLGVAACQSGRMLVVMADEPMPERFGELQDLPVV